MTISYRDNETDTRAGAELDLAFDLLSEEPLRLLPYHSPLVCKQNVLVNSSPRGGSRHRTMYAQTFLSKS